MKPPPKPKPGHWLCACVLRNDHYEIRGFKSNPPRVNRCWKCPCEKPKPEARP